MARGRPVITSLRVAKFDPERRVTVPEFSAPLFVEGLECEAHRITLLGVDLGSTVMPRVILEPSVVMTRSETTFLALSRVSACILPKSSVTQSRPSGPHTIDV